jgi:hypothetical protein
LQKYHEHEGSTFHGSLDKCLPGLPLRPVPLCCTLIVVTRRHTTFARSADIFNFAWNVINK